MILQRGNDKSLWDPSDHLGDSCKSYTGVCKTVFTDGEGAHYWKVWEIDQKIVTATEFHVKTSPKHNGHKM